MATTNKKSIDETMRIIRGSKEFYFSDNENGVSTVLNVTDYHTGETVSLDLSRLTDEMLDVLQYDEPECDDDDIYC